jgi:signal transduction histidine kinase
VKSKQLHGKSKSAVTAHLQEAYHNIVSLYRFSTNLVSCNKREDIFRLLAELIGDIILYRSCAILLKSEESNTFDTVYNTFQKDNLSTLLRRWKSFEALEYTGEEGGITVMPAPGGKKVTSCNHMSIPLLKQGRLIGVIVLETDKRDIDITKQEMDFLALVTAHAAIAIENSILYNNLQKKNEALTKVSKALGESQEQLKAFNLQLEEKIRRRTEEIRITGERLAEEHKKVLSANRALEELNVKLQDMARAKSKLFTSISHELRTPLNAIIGFSDALLDELIGSLNGKQTEYVEHILSNGRNLLKLINEILELARLESGKIRLSFEKINLEKVVSDSVELIRPLLKRKNLSLSIVSCHDPHTVHADSSKVMQIMHNLLSNAAKYTPRDGKIAVSIWESVGGGTIMVAVIDNGIGIPEGHREDVFSEFSMMRRPEHDSDAIGTGLGLSICRKLVSLHGGEIWFDSPPLKQYGNYSRSSDVRGSAFVFSLKEKNTSE